MKNEYIIDHVDDIFNTPHTTKEYLDISQTILSMIANNHKNFPDIIFGFRLPLITNESGRIPYPQKDELISQINSRCPPSIFAADRMNPCSLDFEETITIPIPRSFYFDNMPECILVQYVEYRGPEEARSNCKIYSRYIDFINTISR